jgi:putative ABC transport system permease protein
MIAGVAVAFACSGAGPRRRLDRRAVRGLDARRRQAGPGQPGRTGSAARTATPAIGLGVALLACVVLIQSALLAQVTDTAPRTAPAMVFTEIPGDQAAAFDAEVAKVAGPLTEDTYLRMPFATGRISALKGRRSTSRRSSRPSAGPSTTTSACRPGSGAQERRRGRGPLVAPTTPARRRSR